MKKIVFSIAFFIGLFLSNAQSGNIKGTISDENGLYIPGANITISELSKGAISNFDGNFTFVDIPTGNYLLKITFIGYKDIEQEVVVTDKQTTEFSLFLRPSNTQLDGVDVIAYGRNGQVKALNVQKNNINITNIVSTDQIGKFPDSNIGDAIKRVSGVTIQVDQGEARDIIIRGLSPQLNSVSLNGARIPSAEGDNRNVQLDLIPADLIQTIELSKAVTPDMDADAIGGSVNLITRTSPQGFRVAADLGYGNNFITNTRLLNASFLVGDRSKNGKFGWLATASINDNDFGSDNIEAEWNNVFEYNTGLQDDEGEDILEEVDVNPYTDEFQIRTYLITRIRRSFSLNFDYEFNPNNAIYAKGIFNWRDDKENRFRLESAVLDGEDIGVDDFTLTNGTLTSFPAETIRDLRGGIANDRNESSRLEDQRLQTYSLGGNHLFGKLKFDWLGSYSKASEERLNERLAAYASEFAVTVDNTDPEFPNYIPVNAAEANDLSNFEFDELTEEMQYTEEEDINVFANFELPADFFEQGNGTIKFGARGKFKSKIRENNFFEFDLEDTLPTLADVETIDVSDPDFLAGEQFQTGSFISPDFLGNLNLIDGTPVQEEFIGENFDISENVFAAYALTNQQITNKFSVLLGLRVETTDIESVVNNVIAGSDEISDGIFPTEQVTSTQNYTNVLPGVHLRYDLNKETVLRFAWTNTIARPNYQDLVPTVLIDDDEAFFGNPDLEPTTSVNFDFSAEYYINSIGLLSGGLFYKNIDDFIFTSITEADDLEIFQPQNGESATITGVEVAFQYPLAFLPGFAKNFNIYLNYTYLTSSADGITNEDGEERTDLDELPNTAPNLFNGSIGYTGNKFNARISANFSDAYIDEIGGDAFEDRFYDQQFFLDFNAGYTINKNLRVYVNLNNITNQPLRFYQGIRERSQQVEFYGRKLSFGLKYDLFKK